MLINFKSYDGDDVEIVRVGDYDQYKCETSNYVKYNDKLYVYSESYYNLNTKEDMIDFKEVR